MGNETNISCLTFSNIFLPCFLTWLPWNLNLSSVQFSHSVMSDSLWPHELQHARPPCPSPTPGVHSNSHPLSLWCHSAISSSVVPFSSCPQSCSGGVGRGAGRGTSSFPDMLWYFIPLWPYICYLLPGALLSPVCLQISTFSLRHNQSFHMPSDVLPGFFVNIALFFF